MKLLVALSVFGVIVLSSTVHGTFIKYVSGDGKVPQGDCLEMMCSNGCIEEAGNFVGYCCPSDGSNGGSCRLDGGKDIDECCQSGICHDGKCVACISDVSACQKCDSLKGLYNVVSNTWVDENGCQQCDGKGNIVNSSNGYNQKEGGCCVNGVFGYNATYCPERTDQCNVNGVWYTNGQTIATCKTCDKGQVVNVVNGMNMQPDGKCCVNGVFGYNATYCPERTDQCNVNGIWYTNGQTITATCKMCNNGQIVNVVNGMNTQPDGKCCVDGVFGYNTSYCPDRTGQCNVNGVWYANGQTIDACHKCTNGQSTAVPDGDPLIEQTDKKCCINGVLGYDESLCPKPCESDDDCLVCQVCCTDQTSVHYDHCLYGWQKDTEKHGNQICINRRIERKGKIIADYGGLQNCWSCTGRSDNADCMDLVTGEEIKGVTLWTGSRINNCQLDPRKTWI